MFLIHKYNIINIIIWYDWYSLGIFHLFGHQFSVKVWGTYVYIPLLALSSKLPIATEVWETGQVETKRWIKNLNLKIYPALTLMLLLFCNQQEKRNKFEGMSLCSSRNLLQFFIFGLETKYFTYIEPLIQAAQMQRACKRRPSCLAWCFLQTKKESSLPYIHI